MSEIKNRDYAANPLKLQRAISTLKLRAITTGIDPTEEAIKALYISYGGLVIEEKAAIAGEEGSVEETPAQRKKRLAAEEKAAKDAE